MHSLFWGGASLFSLAFPYMYPIVATIANKAAHVGSLRYCSIYIMMRFYLARLETVHLLPVGHHRVFHQD